MYFAYNDKPINFVTYKFGLTYNDQSEGGWIGLLLHCKGKVITKEKKNPQIDTVS